jgi:protease I
MSGSLQGRRVAILATDGFEQSELMEPMKMLRDGGAKTVVLSPKTGEIRGWNKTDWGQTVPVDVAVKDARAEDYDALVLPGGVMNPDHLRMDPEAMQFVKEFVATERPIASICHGPWTLVEADAVQGQTFTSWPSLKTDLENAGAAWVDEEVVTSGQFISSRKPEDIPAFVRTLVNALAAEKRRKPAA